MKPSEHAARYASGEKEITRRIVIRAAESIKAERVLSLYGAGGFERELLQALPDCAIVSAERDPDLWATQLVEAQRLGFAVHQGDVATVKGTFDLIWLDLTSQYCKSMRDLIATVSKHLPDEDAIIAITLLAARETPEIAADRVAVLPRMLERATRRRVKLVWSYQTTSPMWLVILGGPRLPREVSLDEQDFRDLGWFGALDAWDWVNEFREWFPSLPVQPTHFVSNKDGRSRGWKPYMSGGKRMVRLSDLNPDQRRLVLAMVDMAAATKKRLSDSAEATGSPPAA